MKPFFIEDVITQGTIGCLVYKFACLLSISKCGAELKVVVNGVHPTRLRRRRIDVQDFVLRLISDALC